MRISAVLLAALIVAWACTQPQAENDFWLLARIGAWIVEHHAIPDKLVFPFTHARGYHYNAHEWLAALFLHALDTIFTQDALAIVLGGLGLALFAAVTYMAYLRSNRCLSTALALGMLAMLSENYRHFLRPEIFTLFYLVVFLTLLESLVRDFSKIKLFLIFGLTILWANTHGSFVLTLPIALVFALDQIFCRARSSVYSPNESGRHNSKRISWLMLPVAVLIGSFCTPFGGQLWEFSLGFTHASVAKKDITEWMSPFDSRSFSIVGMYPGLILAIFMLFFIIWKRKTLPIRVVGIGLIFISLIAFGNRFLVYQGIVFAWVAPIALPHPISSTDSKYEHQRLAGLAALAAIALFLSIRFGNMNASTPFDARSDTLFSRGMVHALQDISGESNVFNSYDLGGELIYRNYPRLKPSIDSRIDSYGDAYYFWHETLLDDASQLQTFLKRWDVHYLLLTHVDFVRWQKLSLSTQEMCSLLATDRRIYLFHCVKSEKMR